MATVVCCVLNLIQIQHLAQPVKVGAQKIVLIKALRVVQMYQSAVLLIIPTVVNIRLCVMTGIIKVQTVYAASYVGWGLQHCVLEPDW